MNKTEHVGLSQWELTDRVQMADFNADNLKIDAALAALGGKLEVHSASDPAPTPISGSTIQASRIEWDQWNLFACLIVFGPVSEDYAPASPRLVFSSKDDIRVEVDHAFSLDPILMVFLPRHDLSNEVEALIFADQLRYVRPGFTYEDFSAIFIRSASVNYFPIPRIVKLGAK